MDIDKAFDMLSQTPNDSIRSNAQNFINQHWEEVPNKYTVGEETTKGTFEFTDIEVHVSHVIDTTTGKRKNGDDYRTLAFKELDHSIERGRYYKFSDNYWLTTYTDEFNQVTKDVTIQRCNNSLVWKKDGRVYSYPCVIDYEASGSQPVYNETANTPNSNITLMVQGNKDTLNIEINQKFIISKRPYKIINYVNYLKNGIEDDSVPIIYFDLQLIQESSGDTDIPIPNLKETMIVIEPEISEILQGRTVTLNGFVLIDGVKMSNSITCVASDAPTSNYELISDNNKFVLTNLKYSKIPLKLTFTSGELKKEMVIRLRNIF